MSESNNRTVAIICNAGDGTRVMPLSLYLSKGMFPDADLGPILEYLANQCYQVADEVIIVVKPDDVARLDAYFNADRSEQAAQLRAKGKIEQADRIEQIPSVTVVAQNPEINYGNLTPLLTCLEAGLVTTDDRLLYLFGDDVTVGANDPAALVAYADAHPDVDSVIMAQEVAESETPKFGIVEMDDDGRLLSIVEKPELGTAPSLMASYGCYLLGPGVLHQVQRVVVEKGELWLTSALALAVQNDVPIQALPTAGRWLTTGSVDGCNDVSVARIIERLVHNGDVDRLRTMRDWFNDALAFAAEHEIATEALPIDERPSLYN